MFDAGGRLTLLVVAALAYLFLPLSGTVAFVLARSPRIRFHGAQAIVVGVVWPLALLAASALSASATRVVWGVGALVWLALLTGTALGRDPALPGLRGALGGLAARDEP